MFLLYAEPSSDHHINPAGHPERPDRVAAVLDGVHAAGLDDAVIHGTPRPATREELVRVHHARYLDTLEDLCARCGGMLDADTWAGPGSWQTALDTAGSGLDAIVQLGPTNADFAFVAMRPPGHHARPSTGMGFCLLNNVAVTAAALLARDEQVCIVDWDVHHGNGTQEIFWEIPDVLYVSTHQSPLYPGTGAAGETGGTGAPWSTVNIPLPPGTTGDLARRALEDIAAPVIDRFSPTWTLVSAGFDAHRRDPLASLAFTSADFSALARWVQSFTPGRGHVVLFLEGGYDIEALSMSAGATVSALCGGSYKPEGPSSGGPGAQAIEAARLVWERR